MAKEEAGESAAQKRFRKDVDDLADIGVAIRRQLDSIQVSIPLRLAEVAKAAWSREELERPPSETFEQGLIRTLAGDLALIGLIVGEAEPAGDEVVIQLDVRFISHAIFAADRREDRSTK
ncbi:hypothetical protein [Acrocarpospora macrocephala]|uniref:hypothetical protein n=1 Tax=Acrocarpospora macrocephala TaxID=150177 RepID=UPI0012D370AE|nr:hypothetical protein [Acrocarpospora macrocephala]